MKSQTGKIIGLITAVVVTAVAIWLLWHQGIIGISTRGREEESRIEDFEAVPYLAHVTDDPNPDRQGVVVYDKGRAYPGLNLLTSRLVGGSHLLDMEGNVVQSWLPGDSLGQGWIYSEMDREGNLFVLVLDVGLAKMDWDSRVIWVSDPDQNPYLNTEDRVEYHHDFEVLEDGHIYVLASEFSQAEFPSGTQPIRDESIIILSPDGVPKDKIGFYDLLRAFVPNTIFDQELKKGKKVKRPGVRRAIAKMKGFRPAFDDSVRGYDVFHTNSIEEIPRDIAVAKRGDLLFSARSLDLIGIIDLAEKKLVWTWGTGILKGPHHPTVLDNGNILVFDNGLPDRKYSRVLEIDPATEQIVWKYETSPPEAFFSKIRGGNQRLPNGNTLITESEKGRAFEVTERGDIVWDFWNFERCIAGQRGVIYRMVRYDSDFLKR